MAIPNPRLPEENPFESLRNAIAFLPHDMSEHHRLAWIYGIVRGWGDATEEIAKQHNWDAATVERLIRLRHSFQLAERQLCNAKVPNV